MRESESQDEESIAQGLIEDIIQLKRTALGEGAGSCHMCQQNMAEGMEVVVVVFRRAGSPAFEMQYVLCGEHLDEYSRRFSLGVREVVVRGRFGLCSIGESGVRPVVVSPSIVGVSGASTSSMREGPDGEGVGVHLGGRLACESENSEGRVVPRLRVVMELPVECRVEESAAVADDEEEEVSDDGE